MSTPQEQAGDEPVHRITFPPWPDPPAGVTIIPFTDFQPAGIQRPPLGFADGVELDGLGIPTMRLMNDRTGEDEHLLTKKKKKKGKKKPAGAKVKEEKKQLSWWQEWEEGEDLRRATIVDQGLPLGVRFQQADHDFKQGRAFMPEVQSVYDHWGLFSGLLARIIQAPQHKFQKGASGGGGDDMDISDDDDDYPKSAPPAAPAGGDGEPPAAAAAAAPLPKPKPTPKVTVEDVDDDWETNSFDEFDHLGGSDPEAHIREQEDEEACKYERTESFFQDPVFSIKVFLSSHFRDKGLIWSPPKLEIGPRVITFFLQFLIRNKLFPEYDPKLRAAVLIAQKAIEELPATSTISPLFPELFGLICEQTWGTYTSTLDEMESTWRDPNDFPISVSPTRSKNGSSGSDDGISGWGKTEFLSDAKFEKHLAEGTKLPVSKVETIPEEPSVEKEKEKEKDGEGGWGGAGSGWGDNAQAGTGTWLEEPEGTQNFWHAAAKEMYSFMRLWGPVPFTLCHTHEPTVLELSTRRLIATFEPGTFEGSEQVPGLGCILMRSWKVPDGYTISPAETHDLPLKRKKKGRPAPIGPPQEKIIRVLIDPVVMRKMVLEMLFGGSFVKLAPIGSGPTGAGSSPNISSSATQDEPEIDTTGLHEWWYIEKLMQTLPSYYAEISAPFIDNLLAIRAGSDSPI